MPQPKAPRKHKPENPEFQSKDRTLRQDLLHTRKLKREAAEASARAKDKAEKAARFERYVIDRMDYEGVDSQKADNTSFTPSRKAYATVTDRAAFIAWAQENDEGLIRPAEERKGDLNSLVRRLQEDGEELPPGVNVYIKETLSMRASNA